jgi:hypothetical protein
MLLAETAKHFSQFCRTGQLDPSFKLNPKRAQIYYEHVRGGIESALQRAYPLTCHLLKEKRWNALVDAFLAQEDCATPYLWKMPQFLIPFIEKSRWSEQVRIPYLADLADFEWLEIEIYMMPDCPDKRAGRKGDLLDDPLVVNPESRIITYSYPVFEKKKLPRSMQKGSYPLLTFRHPQNMQVYFIALSPFFKAVLEWIQSGHTGRQALLTSARQFQLNIEETQLLNLGKKFLGDLFQQYAIYGFKVC